MSFAGRAASSSGYVGRPRGRETGLTGYAEPIQRSLPTGSSAMETAEHREPYESRGSRTDLGAPGGESPPGDSTTAAVRERPGKRRLLARQRRDSGRHPSGNITRVERTYQRAARSCFVQDVVHSEHFRVVTPNTVRISSHPD